MGLRCVPNCPSGPGKVSNHPALTQQGREKSPACVLSRLPRSSTLLSSPARACFRGDSSCHPPLVSSLRSGPGVFRKASLIPVALGWIKRTRGDVPQRVCSVSAPCGASFACSGLPTISWNPHSPFHRPGVVILRAS